MKPDSVRSKIQRLLRNELGYLPELASTANINETIKNRFGDLHDIEDISDELIADIKVKISDVGDESTSIAITSKSVSLSQEKKNEIVLTVAQSQGITPLGTDRILEIANNFSISATNARNYRREIISAFKEWTANNLAAELGKLQQDLIEVSNIVVTQEKILSEANNEFDNQVSQLGNQMVENFQLTKEVQTASLGKLRAALGLLPQ